MPSPCSTSTVFHYFLNGAPSAQVLPEDGLWPQPPGADQEQLARKIYAELFAPVLGETYTHPGVFFTPIDFSVLPQSLLVDRPRIALSAGTLDPSRAALTWVLDGARAHRRLSPDSLREAASTWTSELTLKWFAEDRTRLFWYVPQIGYFPDQPVRVRPQDLHVSPS